MSTENFVLLVNIIAWSVPVVLGVIMGVFVGRSKIDLSKYVRSMVKAWFIISLAFAPFVGIICWVLKTFTPIQLGFWHTYGDAVGSMALYYIVSFAVSWIVNSKINRDEATKRRYMEFIFKDSEELGRYLNVTASPVTATPEVHTKRIKCSQCGGSTKVEEHHGSKNCIWCGESIEW